MRKLNAEELNTENLAVKLGLCEMSVKQQSEFLIDYVCSIEGIFDDDVLTDAGTTFNDLLAVANRIKNAVDEKLDAESDLQSIKDTVNNQIKKVRKFAIVFPVITPDASDYEADLRILTEAEVITLAGVNNIDDAFQVLIYDVNENDDADVRGAYMEIK